MTSPAMYYVTVASGSYLPQVAVLAESLARAAPGCMLSCYLVERTMPPVRGLPENLEIIPVSQLGLDDQESLFFRYPERELSMAVRPFVMEHALDRTERPLIYADADLYFLQNPAPIVAKAMAQYSVLLTPHLLRPKLSGDYLTVMRSGVFNSGFIVTRNDSNSRTFLRWWQERTAFECVEDPFGGIAHDQRWLDLAVGLYPFIGILRHPGINVGHWNLYEKQFELAGDTLQASPGEPLVFFHFSGIGERTLSRHSSYELDNISGLNLVLEMAKQYRARLKHFSRLLSAFPPYSFARFADGAVITDSQREALRRGLVRSASPFTEGPALFSGFDVSSVEAPLARNPTQQLRDYPRRIDELQRLRNHPVIGRVIRTWKRLVNPDI
jgi:hypothetical protein